MVVGIIAYSYCCTLPSGQGYQPREVLYLTRDRNRNKRPDLTWRETGGTRLSPRQHELSVRWRNGGTPMYIQCARAFSK